MKVVSFKEPDLKFKVLIINLDSAADRWARVVELLEGQGVEYERISAIDGKELNAKKVYSFPVPLGKWFRPLTRAEVACNLSHRKAWEKILTDGLDYALVLEDDFVLLDGWRDTLVDIINGNIDFDLIKLAREREDKFTARHKLSQGFALGHSYPVPIGNIASLISSKGAHKLLNNLKQITRPIDYELKNYWEYGLELYTVYPNLFSFVDIDEMQSCIGFRAEYKQYSVVRRVEIYLRKYAYQLLHRWYLTKHKLLHR